MAEVELRNVVKKFGQVGVIHGLSASIGDGEFVVIVGPSGCGKSTVLRMVAGLETITDGELFIAGARANDKEPMDRDIAMVFQNYALYPHMTVARNMGYGLRIARVPKAEVERKVAEAAKLLQLEDLLDRKPKQLSGGQRQRVAMGRAIVREPSVFLFDEPLSNLDAKLRVQMRLEIKELQSKLGVTSLYVTHDQVEAMTMADRMIVMNEGLAEQIGSPLDVYERPETLFAAQFIGSPSMNIVDARIEANRLEIAECPPLIIQDLNASGSIKLGIRPEHLEIDPNGPIELSVQMSEPLGANTLLHGKLKGAGESFTASIPGVHRIGQGDNDLRLNIAERHLHMFDREFGKRMN